MTTENTDPNVDPDPQDVVEAPGYEPPESDESEEVTDPNDPSYVELPAAEEL